MPRPFAGMRPAYQSSLLGGLALMLALAAGLLWQLPAHPALAQDESARPKVTGRPAIVSSPASGDTYGAGETVRVALTFSETVTVTGKPRLRLTIGDNVRRARYAGASEDGATLYFAYKVKAADRDDNGISIGKNRLSLNGGTITDTDGRAANLKHKRLSRRSGHKVNGAPAEVVEQPTPESIAQTQATNRAAQFAAESAARSVAENASAGASVGDPVTASDDDGDTLTYALSGADSGAFDFDAASGQISVKDALDYERKSSYSVTVGVSDGKNAAGETDAAVDDTIAVTINVTNVDEAGVVSFSFEGDAPQVDSVLEANLIDPDGSASVTSWAWARSSDGTTWTEIAGERFGAYTPTADDAGHYLRATASYSDPQGSGKTASGTTAGAVSSPPAPIAQVEIEEVVVEEEWQPSHGPPLVDGPTSSSGGGIHVWLSRGYLLEYGGAVKVHARLLEPTQGTAPQITVAVSSNCKCNFTGSPMTVSNGNREPNRLVTITPRDNSVKDGHREVTVTVTWVGRAEHKLKLQIYDDEKTTILLVPPSTSEHDPVTEPGRLTEGLRASVWAKLQGDTLEHELRLTVSAVPGEGAKAGDVVLRGSPVLIIPAGATESNLVWVSAVDNDKVEADKTIILSAHGGDSAPVWLRSPKPREVTIRDNDKSQLSLELDPPGPLAEGHDAIVYVRIDEAWHKGGRVTVQLDDEAAWLRAYVGDDSQRLSSVTCASNRTSCHFDVPENRVGRIGALLIRARSNDIDGPDLTYVKLTATHPQLHPSHLSSGEKPTLRVAIADDDVHPEVRLVLEKTSISENGGRTKFWAELSEPAPHLIRIAPVQSETVCDADNPPCRIDGPASININAGTTRSVEHYTLIAKPTDDPQPQRRMELEAYALETTGGLTLNKVKSVRSAVLTIVNDHQPEPVLKVDPFNPNNYDRGPQFRLMIDKRTISEGEVATVRAQSNDIVRGQPITISIGIPSVDACRCDVEGSFSGLTIQPGKQFSEETFTIIAQDDNVRSPAGELTFEVTGSANRGGTVRSIFVTIVDDD